MPRIAINGISMEYELLGREGAQAVAITPGGRLSKDSPGVRELAEALAAGGRRALIWDRPNCGASDLTFTGDSESELQARLLVALIRELELGPTAVAGGSAGARCSLLAALRHPDDVSHLVQWWISGGTISLMMLGASYACEPAVAASMGGMAAVAALPAFAEPLSRNPRNRDYLLGLDPVEFIAAMERWATAFIPNPASPVPGMSVEDFARLKMPTLLFRGSTSDLYHHARITEWVHQLIPHAKLIDAPWSEDAFARRMTEAMQSGAGHFLDWPLLAPAILEFTGR